MTDRLRTEKLLQELYAARLRGDLDGICATFRLMPVSDLRGQYCQSDGDKGRWKSISFGSFSLS